MVLDISLTTHTKDILIFRKSRLLIALSMLFVVFLFVVSIWYAFDEWDSTAFGIAFILIFISLFMLFRYKDTVWMFDKNAQHLFIMQTRLITREKRVEKISFSSIKDVYYQMVTENYIDRRGQQHQKIKNVVFLTIYEREQELFEMGSANNCFKVVNAIKTFLDLKTPTELQ